MHASRRAPSGPWLYTGALENHPRLIHALARERETWANGGATVRKARAPEQLAEALQHNQLPALDIAQTPPTHSAKRWLVKPRHGAGGRQIQFWRGGPVPSSCYFQQWVEGVPCSALFCGRRDGSAVFFGATRQLIGAAWLRARPFRYCGNVGPFALPDRLMDTLRRMGAMLAQQFSLRGIFGVDFIAQGEIPWLVEVNPRLTAGLEVLERAAGRSFFSHHRMAFSLRDDNLKEPCMPQGAVHGKAILFAKAPVVFPADGPWLASVSQAWSSAEPAEYADIPPPGTRILHGQPILTVFAQAANEVECLQALHRKANVIERQLFRGRDDGKNPPLPLRDC